MKKKLRGKLYTAAQWTWGLPQTLAGAVLYLKHRKDPHFDYNGARVTAWDKLSGVSLGKFIFVPEKKGWSTIQQNGEKPDSQKSQRKAGKDSVSSFLLEHEYGHTIQSLVLGPLYLVIIGLPSVVWMNVPALSRWRARTDTSYYAFYTERWANTLGERVLGEPSVGLAKID
jgi:hypothetical protein